MILVYIQLSVRFQRKMKTELGILINNNFAEYLVSLLRQDWKECALKCSAQRLRMAFLGVY
jgi:hypothetical protein